MKKYFLHIIATILLAVSCEASNTEVNGDDYATASLNISYTMEMESRAAIEDMKLRYVIEIYASEGSRNSGELWTRKVSYEPYAEISLMKGIGYDILVWADYVDNTSEDFSDNYTYSTQAGLKAVQLKERAINGSQSSGDAFSTTLTTDVVDEDFSFNLELTRPLSRLEVYNKTELSSDKTLEVTYKSLFDTYNVMTSEVSASTSDGHYRTYSYTYAANAATTMLFEDYFFVPADGSTLDFTVKNITINDPAIETLGNGITLMIANTTNSSAKEVSVEIKPNIVTKVTGSFVK